MSTIGLSKRLSGPRDEGFVIILLALALGAIFSMAALAIDLTVMATAKQEADNLSRFASLAAIEEVFTNGGSRESATQRAQAVIQGQTSVPTTVDIRGEGGLLQFGTWHFKQPVGDNPCSGNYPCFVNGEEPASAVRLRGRIMSQLSPLFGSVFGASAFEPQVDATAAIVPRHGCFLVDMSPSMASKTHRASDLSRPQDGRGKLVAHMLSKDVNNSALAVTDGQRSIMNSSDFYWQALRGVSITQAGLDAGARNLGRPKDLSVQPYGFDTNYDIADPDVFRRMHYACNQTYETAPDCGADVSGIRQVCQRTGKERPSGGMSWTSSWGTVQYPCQELPDKLGLTRMPGRVDVTERYLGSCQSPDPTGAALDALLSDKDPQASCNNARGRFVNSRLITTCRRIGVKDLDDPDTSIVWEKSWTNKTIRCGNISDLIGRKTSVTKETFVQAYLGACVGMAPNVAVVDESGQGGTCVQPRSLVAATSRLGSDYTRHKTLGDSHYDARNNSDYSSYHPDPEDPICDDPTSPETCHPEKNVRTSPFWFRVDTFRTDEEPGYYGPEPLRQVFEGLHYAVTSLEERAVDGDKACFIFYDEKLSWPRIVHLIGGVSGFDYLKKISDFNEFRNLEGQIIPVADDRSNITDDELTDPATRGLMVTIRHQLFPLPGSNTNTQLALARALLELKLGEEGGIPSSDFIVLIGDGMGNCRQENGHTQCNETQSYHKDAVNEIMATIDNNFVPKNVPVHVMAIGDHVGPHTLDLSSVPLPVDSNGNTIGSGPCLTDEDARKANIKFVRGFSDSQDTPAAYDANSSENPYFEVNEYLYDIARKTRGFWMPIRSDGGSNCEPKTQCFSNNPVTANRVTTDPECRDLGQQITDYMSKIIDENPYLVVDTK